MSSQEKKKDDSSNDLESLFATYAKFGERDNDGRTITLKNIDKWLKQADILGNKKLGVVNADTAIAFAKIVRTMKRMNFEEFKQFLVALETDKKLEENSLEGLLISAGTPSLTNITSPVASGKVGANLRRLTDPNLYTGSYKARLEDEERRRSIEGSVDRRSSTGSASGNNSDTEKSDKKDKERKEKADKKEKESKEKTDEKEKNILDYQVVNQKE